MERVQKLQPLTLTISTLSIQAVLPAKEEAVSYKPLTVIATPNPIGVRKIASAKLPLVGIVFNFLVATMDFVKVKLAIKKTPNQTFSFAVMEIQISHADDPFTRAALQSLTLLAAELASSCLKNSAS